MRGELAKHGTLDHLVEEQTETPTMPTFTEFAERWMNVYPRSARNKTSSVASKRSILHAHLLPRFGKKGIDTIGTFDVEEYKAACLEHGLAPKTVNNVLTVLQRLLRSAHEWDVIEKLPRISFMPVDDPGFRFLSEDEASRLVDAAGDPMLRAAILLGWHAGLRWGEISALGWEDVHFDRRLLHVRRAFSRKSLETPKNRKPRYVPMTETLADALLRQRRAGPYVLMRDGRPLVGQTALVHLRKACERVGIEPCGYHVLRHTFASHLVQRGVPHAVIKELLGHSSIKMTERYAHLQPKDATATRILFAAVGLLDRREHGHHVVTDATPAENAAPITPMRAFDSALNQQENTAMRAVHLLEA
ncbi:MAG: site-specific integrase [Sandaracinaceae bacterium]|nr:site-specific integrase [Sandaracinaceae bacterium]